MKVLLINGSPHSKGCTYTALSYVAESLNKEDIDTNIFHIGDTALRGCNGCGACRDKNRCIHKDLVNEALEIMEQSDGLVIGSAGILCLIQRRAVLLFGSNVLCGQLFFI